MPTLDEVSPPALCTEASSELVRGLGLWQATAVVVSTIIGTGVFLVAGPVARAAGSFDLFVVTWVAGSVIALCGALCFAELGGAIPAAGGLYCYLSRGLGPVWGCMFGWMSAVLGTPAALATVAAGFRFGGTVQLILGSLKIGAIGVIIIAAAFWTGRTAATPVAATIIHDTGAMGAILTAMVPVMWAYNGFQNLGYLGGEIRSPAKNIPKALLYGMFIVGTLYVLLDLMYCRVLPFSQVAGSEHVASDAVQSLFGRSGAAWLTVVMGISALATLHAVVMSESRVTYALSRAGLFFRFAARVQPRHRSPSGALLFVGTIGALIALTGTFEQLFSLYIFAYWIFFALGALALIRLRAKEPELPRPYRVWGYPWTVLLFLIAALALTVNLWLDQPIRSSAGLLVILAGLPCYYGWKRAASQCRGAEPVSL